MSEQTYIIDDESLYKVYLESYAGCQAAKMGVDLKKLTLDEVKKPPVEMFCAQTIGTSDAINGNEIKSLASLVGVIKKLIGTPS